MADSDDSGNINQTIQDAANRYGVDPAYLSEAAAIESGNDPNAVSSTGAKGLFQFTGGTAKQYGLSDPTDPAQNADAAARLTRDNQAKLTTALGRAPTHGELYLAHQQGAAGAIALLTHPDQNAVTALTPAYGGNSARAAQALTVNGGSSSQTAGAFANQWASKFAPGGNASPQNAQAGGNAPGAPLSITPPGAPAPSSGESSATKALAKNYGIAVGDGNKVASAFTTGISAPQLIQLKSTPATAPNSNPFMEQIASVGGGSD